MIKKYKILFLVVGICFLINKNVFAREDIDIKSKYALLYDYSTNEIIYSKNINEKVSPSSLTKLMTAYIVFDKLQKKEISLDDKFIVSIKSWRQDGSRMFLEPEWKVNIDELLKGLIVVSGNDAAITLAEGISGSVDNFVELMNKTAKSLGMKNTNFVNPTGLHEDKHYSSIKDLLILSLMLIDSFPEYYKKYFSIKEYKFNNVNQKNRNVLLNTYYGADGLKTGYTTNGGFGIIASSTRKKQRFIAIVNGANDEKTRLIDTTKLLNYGYNQYKYVDFAKAGQYIINMNRIINNIDNCYLYSKEDIIYPIRSDKVENLKIKIIYNFNNYGKINKNDKIAIMQFIEKDKIREYNLFASENVEGLGKIERFLKFYRRNCKKIINFEI